MTAVDNYDQYKTDFSMKLKSFVKNLSEYVSTDDGQWKVKGFIDTLKNIYTISEDTKIISKILEIHLFPSIVEFAESINYRIILTDHQNYYPDLSFVHIENDTVRFAVDIKTTFRNPDRPDEVNGFTLGSHGAYFQDRDSTKNIQFPYNSYLGHFCLGIIYSRTDLKPQTECEAIRVAELVDGEENVPHTKYKSVEVDSLNSIISVVRDFVFFVCEKWQLASDKQGSGNTANIGSIINIDDIINGKGMFSKLGEDWFDEYWMNFGKLTRKVRKKSVPIRSLREFVEFKGGDVSKIVPKRERSPRIK